MNNRLRKGFTSLSALLLTSFLVSLGGVGTTIAFQQNIPKDFHEQLSSILRKFSHVDESTMVFADEHSIPTPTPTPAGATGATGAEPTISPTPTPTEIEDQNSVSDDVEIEHATGILGATGLQLNISAGAEERHSRDKED